MKKLILFLFIAFCAGNTAYTQILVQTPPCDSIYVIREYPLGNDSLFKIIHDSLVYPEKARLASKQGRVMISFVIDKEGNITDIRNVSRVVLGFGLEEEAIRVVKLLPKTEPHTDTTGQPVCARMTVPIVFKLTR